MKNKIEELIESKNKISLGGGEKRIEKQHKSSKFTARERINLLLDEGSFVEIDAFVKHRCTNFEMEKVEAEADGVVTGYGTVDGRLIFVYAQDFTVLGGSLGEMHAAKICKVQDMAIKMGAPIVGFNDSGGARIQEGVDALSGYGNIFYRNTLASGVVPQISVIVGPCAGGAVYSPALTDFIFMVENTGMMFITGPQVIKSVTGEEVSQEELGGAVTHNKISGVAHFIDSNEEDCIQRIKRLLSYLPSNNLEEPPIIEADDNINRVEERLNEIIPENPNKSYDMKEIINILADKGEFFEVQPYYAQNMITGYIRLNGMTVGVIGNQPKVLAGCIDVNASDKAGRFIRTCDAFNIPLLNLVDVPGFLPGTEQEYGGIIRHGAKMLYAYSEATVPKVTLIIRKAYGGAYLAMCSKDLGADQVFAWPNAEIAVMGPEGAANIIFKKEIEGSEDPVEFRKEKIAEYKDTVNNPYIAASRGYVDDVIVPSTTRPRLISAFDMLRSKREERPAKKHGNIPL
ncbi:MULTISPECIES: acyl-CoA carboxylase subunit beta [Tissierellales]|jgi:methylmalonyl-CoA decarboxylase alpha subunit|uniref:Methylmalonyl-CoA carboxyltransferase n=1 Tax=Acidilutibacter cellobiosedens TaxID=2507161 RepID=A0A410QFP4_9FIRM|nr:MULTISPECIES: carboxyl transferase domain-containing protein [Tissierellales]MBE6082250.1 methylmalonyl-CoA carboxyltransferase [Tissierellaceae bacterium]QAT62745.1 methylmalonyl-CoA carboxyltransferase [Acidilutibacter cellobiosedens]SCL95335.1 Methylmalonyl-CoA carboxyltransferase 12S subunit [Sporanaerobacter sp. PP17-6a]